MVIINFDKQTDAFPRYYGKAVRNSIGTDVVTMKLTIMSGFWHAISRDGDGNHHHIHCDSSWCVFKKAKDEGKPILFHDIMKNYLRFEKKYKNRLREIFFDLSSPVLLERCLRGESENRNEGLHSKLWLHQSKAIIEHNFGDEAN